MKVIQMLASGRMDHKTAGLILYALQTASVNLRYADFELNDVSDIVIDRDTVNATCINGPQWCRRRFRRRSRGGSRSRGRSEKTKRKSKRKTKTPQSPHKSVPRPPRKRRHKKGSPPRRKSEERYRAWSGIGS